MTASEWAKTIDVSLPAWLEAARVPGAAVALLERGAEPRSICAGVQDWESNQPITPETVFEAASLGKPLFACLALKLAGEGLLDLDAPLSGLLPDPWVPDEPYLPLITARRVLSHSAGLPNWFRDGKPRALVFPPGERFGYSGEGYLYLQRVLERLTGLGLEPLARQQLFDPLGMRHSQYVCPEAAEGDLAQGHDTEGKPQPKRKFSANAGTSLHTTLADYCRFLEYMLCGNVSGALEWQTPIDADTAWGLGWGLKRIAGDAFFWQWGDNDGWKHIAVGSPHQGRSVLVLTNGERGARVWKEVLHHTIDPRDEIFAWLSALE